MFTKNVFMVCTTNPCIRVTINPKNYLRFRHSLVILSNFQGEALNLSISISDCEIIIDQTNLPVKFDHYYTKASLEEDYNYTCSISSADHQVSQRFFRVAEN